MLGPGIRHYVRGTTLTSALWLLASGCQHLDGPAVTKNSNYGLVTDNAPAPVIGTHEAADVQIAYARSLEKQGKLDAALNVCQRAVTCDPNQVDSYWRMAVVYDRLAKFAESEPQYRHALALRPDDPEIHCDYGYSLYLQRRYGEAEAQLTRALTVRRDLARAHNNLALVLARTDRIEPAIAEFRLGGSSPAQAHVNVGFELVLERRWDEARIHYQNALAVEPGNSAARDGLARLDKLVQAARTNKPPAGNLRLAGAITDTPPSASR